MISKTIQSAPKITEKITGKDGDISRSWYRYLDTTIRAGFSSKIDNTLAPDSAIVGVSDTQTLENKTLVKPSIDDFANAQHSHSDKAGGGKLSESALALTATTENDATTDKHGFCPMLSGDATTFLCGDGTWAKAGITDPFVTANDIEITDATKGLILKSPDGTRFRVTVTDAGGLTVTSLSP